MPFDATAYRRFANRTTAPAPLDEAAAFARVPQVRRPVRQNVLLPRQPDLTQTWQARADAREAAEWREARRAARMWGWVFAVAALLYLAVGLWLGVMMLDALLEAAARGAGEAVARGGM